MFVSLRLHARFEHNVTPARANRGKDIDPAPSNRRCLAGPAVPHWVEARKNAASFKTVRLAAICVATLVAPHQSNAMAPAICGLAIDVPLASVYALSESCWPSECLCPKQ